MGVFTKEEGVDQAFLGITVKARAQDIFGVSNVVEEFFPFIAVQEAIQEEVLDRLNGAATEAGLCVRSTYGKQVLVNLGAPNP